MRAYSTTDGSVVWDYDTIKTYETVNGVTGRGGSLDGPGPAIGGGMIFFNSGYPYGWRGARQRAAGVFGRWEIAVVLPPEGGSHSRPQPQLATMQLPALAGRWKIDGTICAPIPPGVSF